MSEPRILTPSQILSESPMGRLQIIAVLVCVLLTALDGFDVLSISFAAPGIAREWGIDRAALGIVLSIELIGMAAGSLTLGHAADSAGRRPTILICLVIMTTGMYLASTASSVVLLAVYRFLTGLGIGGMLASVSAMVAEFANARFRSLAVTIMAAGYPLGAIVGGSIASYLLRDNNWRSVFSFGALSTAMCLPLVWFLLPESVEFLQQKRPPNALQKINVILKRMGHQIVEALPKIDEATAVKGIARLFSRELLLITLLLVVAYFFHIMTFYFIVKWIPKIVVDMGFSASLAGTVLVWTNVGGASGSILLGFLTRKFKVRALVMGALIVSAISVCVFGMKQSGLQTLTLFAALAGLFTNAGVVGLYALFVQAFPTDVRAGGTGIVIGVGRGGAALGPMVAGFLFQAGYSLQGVAICMAIGSIISAIAILFLPLHEGRAMPVPERDNLNRISLACFNECGQPDRHKAPTQSAHKSR